MDESILNSVKAYLGLAKDYTPFDQQLMLLINSALADLVQIGIEHNVEVHDDTAKWDDVFDGPDQSQVKTVVCIKTRLAFDPSDRSFVTASLERLLEEAVIRVNYAAERWKDGVDTWST